MEHSIESRSGTVFADRPGRVVGGRSRGMDRTATQRDSYTMDPTSDARVWNALLGDPPLSSAELAALNEVARTRVVSRGHFVFRHEDTARALVFVRDGDVALGLASEGGGFHVERPVHGPGWLDQSSAWLNARHDIDALAVTPLVLVELPRDELQALLVSCPILARRLITSMAAEVHALAANTHSLMHKAAPARFAQWLVERCQAPQTDGSSPIVVRIGERKRDIASQLAITPETLSRVMRSLTRQGVISVAGYTVQVADVEALRKVAAGDD